MNKFIVISIILFNFFNGLAHGSDISTLVFKEQEDNTWTLQIRSSLDAFSKEVKAHFYDCPYTTPEEFKEQLLEHLENTLKISVNDAQNIVLEKGKVKLGHESVVFFNKIKMPNNFNALNITGSMFKEIYRSRVKVLIIKKGFEKRPFLLNKKNNFTADLVVQNKRFALKRV